MERNKKIGLLLVLAFVIGALFTIVLTSQLDLTNRVIASDKNAGSSVGFSNEGATPSTLTQDQENLIAQLNGVFVQAAKRAKPSVVTIYSEKVIKMRRYWDPFEFFSDEFFRQFYGQERPKPKEEKYVQRGMGSGVIVRADGIILTNYHVVKDADDVRVKVADGEEYEAEILGSDPKTDLAVLKIDAKDLPAAPLGDSDQLEVGEWVMAIGNPFSEELRYTVTKGIVSAKGRKGLGLAEGQGYENFIQTDAPINPGNSGGALINLHGEVVGINTAIVTPSGGFAGVGFAIPINMARKVLNDLLTKGKVVRGWLGVGIQPVDRDMAKALGLDSNEGVIVVQVTKGGPADKAGIQVSDVILKYDGKTVKGIDHLRFMVAGTKPGKEVELLINRNGKDKRLKVVIGELEGETAAASQKMANKVSEKLGLEVENLTQSTANEYGYEIGSGVLVSKVDPTSVSYRKGLREGDLIKEVNRKKVPDVQRFFEVTKDLKPGDVALFLVQRGQNNLFLAVEIPEE